MHSDSGMVRQNIKLALFLATFKIYLKINVLIFCEGKQIGHTIISEMKLSPAQVITEFSPYAPEWINVTCA